MLSLPTVRGNFQPLQMGIRVASRVLESGAATGGAVDHDLVARGGGKPRHVHPLPLVQNGLDADLGGAAGRRIQAKSVTPPEDVA